MTPSMWHSTRDSITIQSITKFVLLFIQHHHKLLYIYVTRENYTSEIHLKFRIGSLVAAYTGTGGWFERAFSWYLGQVKDTWESLLPNLSSSADRRRRIWKRRRTLLPLADSSGWRKNCTGHSKSDSGSLYWDIEAPRPAGSAAGIDTNPDGGTVF